MHLPYPEEEVGEFGEDDGGKLIIPLDMVVAASDVPAPCSAPWASLGGGIWQCFAYKVDITDDLIYRALSHWNEIDRRYKYENLHYYNGMRVTQQNLYTGEIVIGVSSNNYWYYRLQGENLSVPDLEFPSPGPGTMYPDWSPTLGPVTDRTDYEVFIRPEAVIVDTVLKSGQISIWPDIQTFDNPYDNSKTVWWQGGRTLDESADLIFRRTIVLASYYVCGYTGLSIQGMIPQASFMMMFLALGGMTSTGGVAAPFLRRH